MEVKDIVKNFKLEGGEITSIEKYGNGHINSTFLVKTKEERKYILQKINNHVFPNVDGLMNNINYVTSYLKEAAKKRGGNPERETLNIVSTNDDKLYFFDGESYYRIYLFVTDSITLESVTSKDEFELCGSAFASFTKLLASFDASKLCEVIVNFHNTETRFNHFKQAVLDDKCGRAKEVQDEIKFIYERSEDTKKVINLIKEGRIPLRVTHNDTKLNNILFDNKTREPLCVIDLDTIMPGSALYDFGDSIRFGCNPAGENERDLSKVNFNIEYFEAYVKGYVSSLAKELTIDEVNNLAFGAKLMTLECGIRFLDDYLDGDHYFHINNKDDNLVRARTQFKLVKDMEEQMDAMNSIVKKYYEQYK